ncbi:hypothetical protein ACFFX0_13950 [Citricoccus parietis]|uniref:Uncharacterized protein n=1 Tax=Citricoccus parietis TaxID=592307 RepID=A0ABV5FZZ9_9MICC
MYIPLPQRPIRPEGRPVRSGDGLTASTTTTSASNCTASKHFWEPRGPSAVPAMQNGAFRHPGDSRPHLDLHSNP